MKKLLHPGNIVLYGFGCMILFMSYLVYQCTQNPSIMVSKNYYEQELKYQDLINARTNTVAYNDSLTMNKQGEQVVFHVPVSINRQLKHAAIQLYNRADDKKDRLFDLQKSEGGDYVVSTKGWGVGNYELKLTIESGEKQYYKEFNYQ